VAVFADLYGNRWDLLELKKDVSAAINSFRDR
jgi:hypothetical protein